MFNHNNPLLLSANELKFLIKRSLEGMGFNPGEQLSAGSRVAGACQYGLIDSAIIRQALECLKPNIKAPVRLDSSSSHTLHEDNATPWCYDAGGQSALVQADLAVGAALSHGIKDILIINVTQGILLAPTLMHWLANFADTSSIKQPIGLLTDYVVPHNEAAMPMRALLLLDATGKPQKLYKVPTADLPKHQINVLLGTDTIHAKVDITSATLVIDAMQFAANLDNTLAHGIPISNHLFQHLKTLMLDSLVPESTASAAGAGPG